MKRVVIVALACLLLLAGCGTPPPALEAEVTETWEQTEPQSPPGKGAAVYSYWLEPAEVRMTEELMERLNARFQPLVEAGTLLNRGQPKAGIRVLPNAQVKYQTMEGFGCSGCWWACFSNSWEELQLDEALMLLYSGEYGIGLTTFRHNVGGGTPEGFGGKGATVCVEAFPGFYDLANDAQGVAVMYKLQSLGVDDFTLFMNSPPARMTGSGSTLGALDGGSNLLPECYEDYAVYCADVVELYSKAGIPIRYISPINEPQWSWKASTYQEGCHYEYTDVAKLDELLAMELERRGLKTKVSIPETAAWYDDVYSRYLVTSLYYNRNLQGKIDHIAGHSYGSKAVHKTALAAYYAEMGMDLPIHQTEWCMEDDDVLSVSRVLHEDLTILNCTRWEYWVGIEPPADGKNGGALVYIDPEGPVKLNLQACLLGQYSKFITGASRIDLTVDGGDSGVYGSAYVKEGDLILILTNETELEQPIWFDGITGTGSAWQTAGEICLQYIGDVDAASGWTLPPRSVTTIVFH